VATKITMNIAAWSYKDFNRFMEAAQAGNQQVQYELAEKLIIGWEYETPLEDGILAVGVAEGAEILRTIMDAIQVIGEDIDYSDVRVNFSDWDTRRFLEFTTASRDSQYDKVVRMLHEVARLDGVNSGEELEFQDGIKMMKAVTEHYRKLITGKN